MREILFRGKANECNNDEEFEYGEWVEGLITFVGSYNGIYSATILTDEYDECQVDPETVGQYTGLTDKNGVKIFEGDILRFYNGEEFSNYEVIWFGNAYKVLMEGETEIQDDLDLFFCEHSEVIGNIHDTPKL